MTGTAENTPYDKFVEVAAVYLAALDVPRLPAPLRAVREKWGVSAPTASRWARVCRDRGLIPPVADGARPRGTDICPTCGAPPSRWGPSGRHGGVSSQ